LRRERFSLISRRFVEQFASRVPKYARPGVARRSQKIFV
jgi:hypothetical protein